MNPNQKPKSLNRTQTDPSSSKAPSNRKPGFALAATVITLSLLVVLALGLATLAQTDTRSSAHLQQQAIAENNALIGLKNAIGELQLALGPDQMISANASILTDANGEELSVANPHWMGTWHSWRAGNGTYERDIDPPSHHSSIFNNNADDPKPDSMHPTYLPNRQDHFHNWLVSLTKEEAASLSSPFDLRLDGTTHPDADADSVCLVDTGTLGQTAAEQDKVRARLMQVQSKLGNSEITGRYGWWVGDESQKARILGDPYRDIDPSRDLGDALFRQQAPGTTGTTVVKGLENVRDDRKLTGLQSLQTINLVNGIKGKPSENFHHITSESFGVLADVREGGLKRDLSTLLEQPIDLEYATDDRMLYRFGDDGEQQVPLQDLSAYYQLYDNDPEWERSRRGGVIHDSGIKVETPFFGGRVDQDREKYLREYTSIYRNPVPIKVQFLLAMGANKITEQERQQAARPGGHPPIPSNITHKLTLGIMPVVTLWNPNNLPLVMNHSQRFYLNTPPFALRWRRYEQGDTFTGSGYFNLNYAQGESTGDGRATRTHPHVMHLQFAKTAPVVFQPGEVKMFSLPLEDQETLNATMVNGLYFHRVYEPINRWNPFGFFRVPNCSTVAPDPENQDTSRNFSDGRYMLFGPDNRIAFEVVGEGMRGGRRNHIREGTNIAGMNELWGAGFNFYLLDHDFAGNPYDPFKATRHHFRHYQLVSRYGGTTDMGSPKNALFNRELISRGFPDGNALINFESRTNAIPGSQLIGADEQGEVRAFLQFSMAAGCEAHNVSLGGYSGGRRITSRPFLHGATIAAPFIDQTDPNSLYNYGWEWQIDPINDVEDSTVQGDPGNGCGFFGGGYTIEAGSTHVIQQTIPVAPPISIASLSHAHLGGFSLANAPAAAGKDDNITWKDATNYRSGPEGTFQKVTATGQAGLAPHVMQAIGNSYAHPQIPADKAHTTWERHFDSDVGPRTVNFADHSYLANKALWDEYFFSSITPQSSDNPVFNVDGSKTALEVAMDFFKNGKSLPNIRLHPFMDHFYDGEIEAMFDENGMANDDFADQIASHLMVEGPFNINSTSVEAWKIFLSSLRGKAIATLDKDGQVESATTVGVPVGPGNLPAGPPVASQSIRSFNQPREQWNSWREISDKEIEELAEAIVKQVKMRGPFLSLSEFVNRRLDPRNPQFSVKGALQAALDDPNVSINRNFRSNARKFTNQELATMNPEFREALEGPVAYGSAAYVDQADILRHFGSLLTPRGDTFVIRSYGDAVDSNGNVTARAWCEAVVQRIPTYVDSNDNPKLSYADLPDTSVASRRFGRKLQLVSFRWLHPSEL